MSFIGALAWKAFGWAMPGMPPALIYLLAAFLVIALPAGAVWIHMHGRIDLAAAERDIAWKDTLKRTETEHDAMLRGVTDRADELERRLSDLDRAGVERLCKQSGTLCRDNRQKR